MGSLQPQAAIDHVGRDRQPYRAWDNVVLLTLPEDLAAGITSSVSPK